MDFAWVHSGEYDLNCMCQGSVVCTDPCISGKMLVSAVGICIRKSTSRYDARCCVSSTEVSIQSNSLYLIYYTVPLNLLGIQMPFLLYYYFRLGADVIYDPVCLPHLVRVLAILLGFRRQRASCKGLSQNIKHENVKHDHKDAIDGSDGRCRAIYNDGSNCLSKEAPVAYIACVIRNVETFNDFLSLGEQANLDIVDLTDSLKPVNLLCYMQSYNQASVRLLRITCSNIN